MNIFNFFTKKQHTEDTSGRYITRQLSRFASDYSPLFTSTKDRYAMNLSAVFRAIDLISGTVASLPINIYKYNNQGIKSQLFDHPAHYILSKEPNSIMSRHTFIKCLVINTLLRGNGYAYIMRDTNGEVKELRLLNPDEVNVLYDKQLQKVAYSHIDYPAVIDSCDMIHILNVPDIQGIKGISTLEYARQTIKLSTDAENMASNFFGTSSLTGYLKIKTIGSAAKKQKDDARQSWSNQIRDIAVNGVPVLDEGQDFVPLSVKDEDIQLLESRKFNIESIARFFNVSPILLFDLTKNSYSSSEHASLQLLNDCISPILEKFELEFERKLFLPSVKRFIDVKFDESAMLRLDQNAKAEYFTKLLNIGVLCPNEIRESLYLPPITGGDIHVLQTNTATFKEITNRSNNTL